MPTTDDVPAAACLVMLCASHVVELCYLQLDIDLKAVRSWTSNKNGEVSLASSASKIAKSTSLMLRCAPVLRAVLY
jgi:hypothetical protein